MQSSSEGSLLEIIDLAHSLRQEQLFISGEQNAFIKLNTSLSENSENVSQLAWICAQQRQNLNNLIISKPENGPSFCCRRANNLENTKFIPAYKANGLKYQYTLAYTDLFNYLHRSPYLLAQCLAVGDRVCRLSPDLINSVIQTIATGLYDNAIHSKDVEMVLKLLQDLIQIQIVDSDNPRRMFRTGSCAFSRLYHRLHESLFSAKLFLTAALYEPITKVLIEDEIMLDIDPNKAIANYPAKDRLKKFGQPGTDDYNEKLRIYKQEIIEKLFQLANHFLQSLTLNWPLLPSTLRWLVQSMCHLLKRSQFSDKDINALLTEMIFTNFICSAIVSPDLYGISDVPISENARFNLIQIGQILQMLALMKHEDVDPKMLELYNKFDRNLISDLLELLLPNDFDLGISMLTMSPHQNNLGRKNVLVTQSELNIFIDFLRNVLENDGLTISGEDRRKLSEILERLPDKWENIISDHHQQEQQIQQNNKTTKQTLINNLQKKTKSKLAKTITLNVTTLENDDLPSGINNNNNNYNNNISNIYNNNHNHNNNNNNNQMLYEDYEQVLIVPISICEETKFHLLTEDEVLNMNNISSEVTVEPILTEKNVEELERRTEENETLDGVVIRSGHQKLARFSLSHDDASIGNTSDNLEVVSEAPSNHSVASSINSLLEENYQNDNLSDMVSANVSGRGTPNISGRDTPSSQVTEGGDNRTPQIPTTQMAKILSKARSDIEDKFCKFEIKKLLEGDETISIISDTWSTDVLASDSETIEASDRDRNFSTPLIPSAVILPGDNNFDPLSGAGSQLRSQNLDVSETQSESAWSTDVLASDSEKMTEVDTDDNQSIAAKSDITDAGRSEGEPNRDNELLVRLNRAPDSPMFFTPRIPNIQFRTPDYHTRTSEVTFFGNRNFDESTVNPLLRHSRHHSHSSNYSNMHDSAGAVGGPIPQNPQPTNDELNPFVNESGVFDRATNSEFSEYDRQSYLSPAQSGGGINLGTRQNSIESNNSEISSNFDRDDKKIRPFDYRKQTKAYVENTPPVRVYQPYEHTEQHTEHNNNNRYQFTNFDRELFDANNQTTTKSNNGDGHNDVPENIIKTSTDLINPFEDDETHVNYEISTLPNKVYDDDIRDELVEHRRISSEQRNASFDGRRNGMIDYTASTSTSVRSTTTSIVKKRSDYENHQIQTTMHLITTKEEKPINLLSNQPDDDLILSKQTQSLCLMSPNTENNNYSSLLDVTTTKNNVTTSKSSTGAIPKSISFDSSADKITNRTNNVVQIRRSETARVVHGTGFFNKIKQGFKNRRGNKFRNTLEDTRDFVHGIPMNHQLHKNPLELNDNDSNGTGILSSENGFNDTTEDILAKYRRKASSSSDAAASDSTGSNASSSKSKSSQSDTEQRLQNGMMITNDTCFLFNNAKRKLRVVLSSTDLQTTDFHHTRCGTTSPLLIYLQIQLAQALNLQNLKQVSFVSEAIRCVNSMDIIDHQKLLEELQQDLFKRQSYLQYLIRYRQNLLTALESIDRFEDRLQNDREMCNRHLIMVCVRMFLEKREHSIIKFVEKFSTLTVVDEKIDYLEECMVQLMDELKSDGILQGMADWQLQEARTSIERILLQRLYRQVMFPNDDGDIARDQVLCEHIRKLSRLISPSHRALRIPQEYLIEAPWPFAQQQIAHISAYKTPKDKVQCVVRCITSIMNLLSMGSNRIPSADDLTPVLIYVVIRANPPYLLSTIEYVNCFIGDKLEGETQYWWTQFCSAVQFIKTMDYGE